jgi:hypothetical protein
MSRTPGAETASAPTSVFGPLVLADFRVDIKRDEYSEQMARNRDRWVASWLTDSTPPPLPPAVTRAARGFLGIGADRAPRAPQPQHEGGDRRERMTVCLSQINRPARAEARAEHVKPAGPYDQRCPESCWRCGARGARKQHRCEGASLASIVSLLPSGEPASRTLPWFESYADQDRIIRIVLRDSG